MATEQETTTPELMELEGKRVTVMGLGSFGGGVGAARFLIAQGARVTVTDLRTEDELAESIDALADLPVRTQLGGHEDHDFNNTDLVVVNPAVHEDSPFLAIARTAGVPLTSEMNLFFARCAGKIVGISGSNGKSTTASLTAHLMEGSGRKVWLGGNMGISLLEQVNEITADDAVVLELSSFQLEMLHNLRKSPTVAVMLNLTPNHLDRHGCFEAYVAAKLALIAYQQPRNIALLNFEDMRVQQLKSQVPGRMAMFSTLRKVTPGGFIHRGEFAIDLGKGVKTCGRVRDLPLIGRHNEINGLAAVLAAAVMKTPPGEIAARLKTFKPLPHRLETVGERDGVSFYDDSKATTPEATIAALGAFYKPFWLIAGGRNKGVDYTDLAAAIVRSKAAGVVSIGEIGEDLTSLIRKINAHRKRPKQVVLEHAGTLAAAMDRLRHLVQEGDTVVLAPGAASFDQYKSYEERGEHFKLLTESFERVSDAAVDTTAHDEDKHSVSRTGRRTRADLGETKPARGLGVPPGTGARRIVAPMTPAAAAASSQPISSHAIPVPATPGDGTDGAGVSPPTPMSLPAIEEQERMETVAYDSMFEGAGAAAVAEPIPDATPITGFDTGGTGSTTEWGDDTAPPIPADISDDDWDAAADPFESSGQIGTTPSGFVTSFPITETKIGGSGANGDVAPGPAASPAAMSPAPVGMSAPPAGMTPPQPAVPAAGALVPDAGSLLFEEDLDLLEPMEPAGPMPIQKYRPRATDRVGTGRRARKGAPPREGEQQPPQQPAPQQPPPQPSQPSDPPADGDLPEPLPAEDDVWPDGW